jgi:hypothetical protein
LGTLHDKKFAPMPRCLTRENRRTGNIEIMRIGTRLETFEIRGVAATVWKRFNGKTPVSALIRDVTKNYDVSSERASSDIEKFIRGLLRYELIREIPLA